MIASEKMITKLTKSIERLESSLSNLEKSFKWIETKNILTDISIGRDAIAKQFETSVTYFWRMLETASMYQGTEAPGPRPSIQAAMQYGWIENAENYIEYLEVRNQAVHDYFEISDEQYFQIAINFLKDSKETLTRVKKDLNI
jgi:uncharacterized protein YutE (UPF0331/DUF86 family)